MARYYCRGADGPNGHCDDRPHTIQCDYCIWEEQQSKCIKCGQSVYLCVCDGTKHGARLNNS